jgi:phosphopantetheinyl transferase (holo-ACP synthase)
MHIRSFVETVSLKEIANHRPEIESSCFALRESPSSLRLRTLAGIVCVKKAVRAALGSTGLRPAIGERDIVVGHDGPGRPVLLEMPRLAHGMIDTLCVSLSHTKNHAWGCAVIQGDKDNA